MTVHHSPTTATHTCGCNDPDLDRLRDLTAAGMSQPAASRLIWSGPDTDTVHAWVRHQLLAAFPWLRLPEHTP